MSIFHDSLTPLQARYAIRAIIREHPDLDSALCAAGYKAYDKKRYTGRQRQILSRYISRRRDLIVTYQARFKNYRKH